MAHGLAGVGLATDDETVLETFDEGMHGDSLLIIHMDAMEGCWGHACSPMTCAAATAAPMRGAAPPSSPGSSGMARVRAMAESAKPARRASHHKAPDSATDPETTTTSGSSRLTAPPSAS
ncbi:hypothetical protein BIFGAL_04404, partial [Bifidobacterium gallicum DSM 20093 = LMG 11596]